MRILGTYNHKPFSWLIRKITKSRISHVTILFDDLLIFHSNPSGTQTGWFEDFMKSNKIALNLPLPLPLIAEEQVFFQLIAGRRKRKYDWWGILFQGWHRIREAVLGVPMPLVNKWQNPHKDFCIEVLHGVPWDSLKAGLQAKINALPLDMMSPEEAIISIQKVIGDSYVYNG